MATHSSILAQKIPWTEESDWLQSMQSKELDMTELACMSRHLWTSYCLLALSVAMRSLKPA